MKRLSVSAVKSATRPGRFSDGDGLYLVVQPGGSKSWVCRVQKAGNRRDFGLGSASKVSLADARERAREIRSQVAIGLDPLFERRSEEHTSELQSLMRISYAVFCLKKKINRTNNTDGSTSKRLNPA